MRKPAIVTPCYRCACGGWNGTHKMFCKEPWSLPNEVKACRARAEVPQMIVGTDVVDQALGGARGFGTRCRIRQAIMNVPGVTSCEVDILDKPKIVSVLVHGTERALECARVFRLDVVKAFSSFLPAGANYNLDIPGEFNPLVETGRTPYEGDPRDERMAEIKTNKLRYDAFRLGVRQAAKSFNFNFNELSQSTKNALLPPSCPFTTLPTLEEATRASRKHRSAECNVTGARAEYHTLDSIWGFRIECKCTSHGSHFLAPAEMAYGKSAEAATKKLPTLEAATRAIPSKFQAHCRVQ